MKGKSRNRAGKKKRLNIIACRGRKLERKKVDKKIQKEMDAKIKKKMFHKRGGKKHKKSADPAQSKRNTEQNRLLYTSPCTLIYLKNRNPSVLDKFIIRDDLMIKIQHNI